MISQEEYFKVRFLWNDLQRCIQANSRASELWKFEKVFWNDTPICTKMLQNLTWLSRMHTNALNVVNQKRSCPHHIVQVPDVRVSNLRHGDERTNPAHRSQYNVVLAITPGPKSFMLNSLCVLLLLLYTSIRVFIIHFYYYYYYYYYYYKQTHY